MNAGLWTCPDCLSQMPTAEKEDHKKYHPNAEQLNEPESPTQMQIDHAFIHRLMLAIGDCHYAINRMDAARAQHKIREVIDEIKGDHLWQVYFKTMTKRG